MIQGQIHSEMGILEREEGGKDKNITSIL